MFEQFGTHEFGTNELEGLAKYLRQRAASVKKQHKKDVFIRYAVVVEDAADRICKLERSKE